MDLDLRTSGISTQRRKGAGGKNEEKAKAKEIQTQSSGSCASVLLRAVNVLRLAHFNHGFSPTALDVGKADSPQAIHGIPLVFKSNFLPEGGHQGPVRRKMAKVKTPVSL